MKTYKWLRGLLKASAFTAVMFVMQACYGVVQPTDDPYYNADEKENYQPTEDVSSIDQPVTEEVVAE